jgi:ATP-dependent Clp protease ATP-binding subunit ClpA
MIERFTDAAVNAIILAEKEARELGHHSVDSAQIMLGILGTICDGTWVLCDLGIDIQEAVRDLKNKIGTIDFAAGKVIYTATAKDIFQRSCACADKRDSENVGTPDLLIGIVQCGKGAGFELLKDLSVTEESLANSLRNRILSEQTEYKHPSKRTTTKAQVRDMIAKAEKVVEKREAATEEARQYVKTLRAYLKQYLDQLDDE